MKKTIILIIGIIIIAGFFVFVNRSKEPQITEMITEMFQKELGETQKRVNFAIFADLYRFSAEVSVDWQVEYSAATDSINIFNPGIEAESNLEKSQIFIRNFEANQFLTLSTVDINNWEETTVNGHDAVHYEITKKPGVPNFVGQPSWRSLWHPLTDVRLSQNNPSLFYVFARNPELDSEIFKNFIASLNFHNDSESFLPPIDQASARLTKKPFGIEVSPENSPVDPERFSGFHTGADFEVFPGEATADVPVSAVCGGAVLQKQSVNGYGGVLVQECLRENQLITVLYGHLRLPSIAKSIGEYLSPGEFIGFLGTGETEETDGQRKHLHLGVHQGSKVELRGYVDTAPQLDDWVDPLILLK